MDEMAPPSHSGNFMSTEPQASPMGPTRAHIHSSKFADRMIELPPVAAPGRYDDEVFASLRILFLCNISNCSNTEPITLSALWPVFVGRSWPASPADGPAGVLGRTLIEHFGLPFHGAPQLAQLFVPAFSLFGGEPLLLGQRLGQLGASVTQHVQLVFQLLPMRSFGRQLLVQGFAQRTVRRSRPRAVPVVGRAAIWLPPALLATGRLQRPTRPMP